MTRKGIVGALALGLALTAGWVLAPGVARAEDGAIVGELRELKDALVEVMVFWQRQAYVDERSTVLRDIDVMDRNIVFLDAERLRFVEERAEIQEQIQVADQGEQEFQRQASSELGEALQDALRGRMERSRALVAAKQERLLEVQQRIDELLRDVARRRVQRNALEEELESMLPTGS